MSVHLEIESTLRVPGPFQDRGEIDVTLEINDHDESGYEIETITIDTTGDNEKRSWLYIGRDHPLFDLLRACVNERHVEEMIQVCKEEMAE